MQTKSRFTYKILCCVWFFHHLCGNPELPCFNTWKNLDVNSHRKWITDLYLTFIPSNDIWDRPTSFFLDVLFVILCKKLIEKKRALGCQLQSGKYIAKLLCCHVWGRNAALSFKMYTSVREGNMTCLLINKVFLIHAYQRKKNLFSCLS